MIRPLLKRKLWLVARGGLVHRRTHATIHEPYRYDYGSRSNLPQRRKLDLELDGEYYQLDSWTLRDSCPCSLCIDPSTTQKCFDATEIPVGIEAKDIEVHADGSFSVSWTEDIEGFRVHRSNFPAGFLRSKGIDAVVRDVRQKYPRILWERADLDAIGNDMTVKYADYMAGERTLHLVTRQLLQYGIAFISNVPSATDAVESIASRIGPLKNTIYGSTWDVRSLSSAKNVADTSRDLGFHMDLLYYKEPPKLQVLHYLKQSHLGGASLFSDSFKAVSNIVRRTMVTSGPTFDSVGIAALTEFMQPFHYKNNGHWLEYQHPTIVHDGSIPRFNNWRTNPSEFLKASRFENALKAVRWSPPFRAPMLRKQNESKVPPLDYWIEGATLLKTEFERDEAIFETRMQEGTCVIFDNWRILHGRRAFSGGERWLRGAYIDDDTFTQRVLQLVC